MSRYLVVVTCALLLNACSGQGEGPAAEPERPSSVPVSAAPAPTSAFCLDLGTFQFAVTHYVAEVGQAIEGEALDFKELRRQGDNIARLDPLYGTKNRPAFEAVNTYDCPK